MSWFTILANASIISSNNFLPILLEIIVGASSIIAIFLVIDVLNSSSFLQLNIFSFIICLKLNFSQKSLSNRIKSLLLFE